MRRLISVLWMISILAVGTAWAQSFPPNEAGVTMGHWHLNICKKLEAAGIKLDRPYTKNQQTGSALAFISDPWGTYIELNERSNPL